jgi:hypothetical protein
MYEPIDGESQEEDVVETADYRDHIGYQIERSQDIGERTRQDYLVGPGHPRVTEQSQDEPKVMGNTCQ